MTHISLHSEAASEMNWAATYYENHAQGLGQAFPDELQKAFEQIAEMPEANIRTGNRLRKKALLRFPYTIIYAFQTERIRVLPLRTKNDAPTIGNIVNKAYNAPCFDNTPEPKPESFNGNKSERKAGLDDI